MIVAINKINMSYHPTKQGKTFHIELGQNVHIYTEWPVQRYHQRSGQKAGMEPRSQPKRGYAKRAHQRRPNSQHWIGG